MVIANSPRNARRIWAKALRKYVGPGKVVFVNIRHDPQCMIYSSERVCTCEPVRELLDERGRALAQVSGGGSFDPLEMGLLASQLEGQAKHSKEATRDSH